MSSGGYEMNPTAVFKRYELKYLMDQQQFKEVKRAIDDNMRIDGFGHSLINNIYLDTENYLLARRSIDKPVYKEKLRIRSYGTVKEDDPVFVELKKKYESVVYKRRLSMPLNEAMEWFTSVNAYHPDTQIGREIDYTRQRYEGIGPRMLLSYEREAYRPIDGSDLRITLDTNIRARLEDVDLTSIPGGIDVAPKGAVLMEVKTLYGFPSWLNSVLSANRVYKISFSKYGNAYKMLILGKNQNELYSQSGTKHTLEMESSGWEAGNIPSLRVSRSKPMTIA